MYLYHEAPERFIGTSLVPLSTLRVLNTALYEKYAQKYKGRELVLEIPIHQLLCYWEDVVFLSVINPCVFQQVFDYVGMSTRKMQFFEIDTNELDWSKTVLLDYSMEGEESFHTIRKEELHEYIHVPANAIAYYQETLRKKERVFKYHLVPHILYKGSIDVRHARIVETCSEL
jgi:hypothetical protein